VPAPALQSFAFMEARKRVVSPTLQLALVIVAGLASASFGLASMYALFAAARPF
jgi:hypothetical protein